METKVLKNYNMFNYCSFLFNLYWGQNEKTEKLNFINVSMNKKLLKYICTTG